MRDLTPGVAALMNTTHFSDFNKSMTPASSTALGASHLPASLISPSRFATSAVLTSKPTAPLSKPKTGVIAGGAAGGCAVTLLLAAGFTFYMRRRRKHENRLPEPATRVIVERPASMRELHTDDRPVEGDGQELYEMQSRCFVELEGHATERSREPL